MYIYIYVGIYRYTVYTCIMYIHTYIMRYVSCQDLVFVGPGTNPCQFSGELKFPKVC